MSQPLTDINAQVIDGLLGYIILVLCKRFGIHIIISETREFYVDSAAWIFCEMFILHYQRFVRQTVCLLYSIICSK